MNHGEKNLAAIALALGAAEVSGWTRAESDLVHDLPQVATADVSSFREQIRVGRDPLGDEFCRLRSAATRRARGATYTPASIVRAMADWAVERPRPRRVVDPGVGSARFLVEVARRMKSAELIGVEVDSLAALIARGHLAAAGFASRSRILWQDYRQTKLPPGGQTLFLGNPPYVRHHQISSRWKQWLTQSADKLNLPASQLAGLHAYFFLQTAMLARKGDGGVLITSAEWLDVNYGELVRRLFSERLGGQKLVLIEPTALPFPDAATTAVIVQFTVGTKAKSVSFHRVARLADLKSLNGAKLVQRDWLASQTRWSQATQFARNKPADYIELGELCRVHRGQVTGANKVWIAGTHSAAVPERLCYPAVTRARELFSAAGVLSDDRHLRRVIDIPADLNELNAADRRRIERFFETATAMGAADTYVARHRKAWWSVGLRAPAPILATYMARRPPAFVRNLAGARHINIAHGLYPRTPVRGTILDRLAAYLSSHTDVERGRTYAGGLTKFEPREMERLLIPRPETLAADVAKIEKEP